MIIWKIKLKTWLFDYIFRVDNGLWEHEMNYYRKFKKKKEFTKAIKIDRVYNQLLGKFMALVCLASDFNLPVPATDRIKKRIKLTGGKIKK